METAIQDDPEIIEAGVTTGPGQAKETRVVKYSVTTAEIAKLQEEYKEVPADLTVKKNYEMVRKATAHLRGLRGDVEKRRKELKADALAWGKLVDGTAKEITEKLLAIEEPFATAKKDFDTAAEIAKREAAIAEERRVDGIAERIDAIKSYASVHVLSSSDGIHVAIEELKSILPCDWADEFKNKAELAAADALVKLEELHAMKLQQEQAAVLAAEAEAKRKQEEEEARKQREKEVEEERAKLAAEREAMEAEKARLAAEQKERDEKAAAERKEMEEKAAAEKAEADRIQKEKDDAAEAERQRMADEIADLKRQQEEREKPVVEPEVAAVVADQIAEGYPKLNADPNRNLDAGVDDYKEAGRAMIKFIRNRGVTKALLDAIINNEIPNIQFTGQA